MPNNVPFHRFLLSSTSGSPAAEEMGAARKLDMTIKSLPSSMYIVIIVCRGIKVNLQKVGSHSTVISVNMPTPHFYRKYAHPFSEGSFLKILW